MRCWATPSQRDDQSKQHKKVITMQYRLCLLFTFALVGCQSQIASNGQYDPEDTYTEIYSVRDLLERPYGPALQTIYEDDPFALEMLSNYDLAWRVWVIPQPPLFEPTYPDEAKKLSRDLHGERMSRLLDLSDLFRSVVGDSGEWIDETSTIDELNSNFVIHTTKRNHRQIEQLLARMREADSGIHKRFMREVEAARLLRKAEELRRDGKPRAALDRVIDALLVDPHYLPAIAMREALETQIRNGGIEE